MTLFAGSNALAQVDDLEVALTPATEEYCHTIRFPQAWAVPRTDPKTGEPLHLGYGFGSVLGELEFRIEGLQGTQFLIGGFSQYFLPRLDTTNQFIVDFSNGSLPIRVATKAAWDAATVVPTTRKGIASFGSRPPEDKPLAVNGFRFVKSGEIWDQESAGPFRFSPDQIWLVLQSEARLSSKGARSIYFDAFAAETGRKIVTIQGTFSSDAGGPPDDVLSRTGWVTERYFVVPLGKRIDRLLVCEFDKHGEKGSEEHRKR